MISKEFVILQLYVLLSDANHIPFALLAYYADTAIKQDEIYRPSPWSNRYFWKTPFYQA